MKAIHYYPFYKKMNSYWRLYAAHNRYADKTLDEDFILAYFWDLSRFSIETVLIGIEMARKTLKQFPSIAHLYELCSTVEPIETFNKAQKEAYAKYLNTDHWKMVREGALQYARNTCQVCGIKEVTLNVHHKTYKNLGKERMDDLVVMCESCHKAIHGIKEEE